MQFALQIGLFYLMNLSAYKQFGSSSKCQIGLFCATPSIRSKVDNMAGFKRQRFPLLASHSATGIPLVYIHNFTQIWCGTPFYGMPWGLNSCRMYLEPHGSRFESSGRKYVWTILLCSNTRFHRVDCNLWQCQPWHGAWSPDGSLPRAVTGNCNPLKLTYEYHHPLKT